MGSFSVYSYSLLILSLRFEVGGAIATPDPPLEPPLHPAILHMSIAIWLII